MMKTARVSLYRQPVGTSRPPFRPSVEPMSPSGDAPMFTRDPSEDEEDG
jgi:hypothetical protein